MNKEMKNDVVATNVSTNEIVLYQPNGTVQMEVRLCDDTVWLNRNQIATLFDRDIKTIGKHINNALREELCPTIANFATVQSDENPVVAKNATTEITPINQKQCNNPVVAKFAHMGHDGKQRYSTKYYNLDVILARFNN